MSLLVSAAADAYDPGTFAAAEGLGCAGNWLEVVGEAKRSKDADKNSAIQYTVYNIKKGANKDLKILAFMVVLKSVMSHSTEV